MLLCSSEAQYPLEQKNSPLKENSRKAPNILENQNSIGFLILHNKKIVMLIYAHAVDDFKRVRFAKRL